jgi:hypothetical protein
MNQKNLEDNIKQILYNQTHQIFCPEDALWIHCNSTFYINHSNECGPRTLLALHIMAFHPNPHANMLLPIMDSNIAQISRTWIAASLLSGSSLHHALTGLFQCQHFQDNRHSNTMQSHPYDILQWDDVNQYPIYDGIEDNSTSIGYVTLRAANFKDTDTVNIPTTMLNSHPTPDNPSQPDIPDTISICTDRCEPSSIIF